MPRLLITAGAAPLRDLQLSGDLTIGRDPQAGLTLKDVKASRIHAEIRCRDGGWELVDRDSANGTWVGEDRVMSLPLRDGVTFRIGGTVLRFASDADEGEALAADAADSNASLLSLPPDVDRRGLERANRYLVLLHQLVLKAQDLATQDACFDLLDEVAAEILERDRIAVFLPAADGWTLWPPHARRLAARFGGVPFATTLLNAARTRLVPLRIATEGDLAPSASMLQAGVGAAMAAPVRLGGRLLALLYVDRVGPVRPYAQLDLEFLAAVANQVAVSLANLDQREDLRQQVARLVATPRTAPVWSGHDPAPRHFAERIGPGGAPVLLRGEAGTGRELLARLLHHQSPRASGPFTVIACGNITDADATLGGGARPGLIEVTTGGTVYLDEIEALPAAWQQRILDIITQGSFTRPGDGALRRVEVRVIASEWTPGRLRSDLLARLEGFALTLLPLRGRGDELTVLCEAILAEDARRHDRPTRRLAPDARAVLMRHAWPGNVRELRSCLERASALADGAVITAADLPEHLRTSPADVPTTGPVALLPLAEVERSHIQRVLAHVGGNKKAAAEVLGIDRSTLYAKLRQYGE